MEKYPLAILLIIFLSGPIASQEAQAPEARKEAIVKTHFGDSLVDQYSWMEDRTDPAVLNHLFAENQYLENSLGHTHKFQEHLVDEFKSRMTPRTRPSLQRKVGEYLYYSTQSKRDEHPIYYRRKSSDQTQEIVLEVAKIDPGNPFINLKKISPTLNGEMIAYSVDYLGNEALSVHFKDQKTGTRLEDEVPMTSDFFWLEEGKSILYVKRDSLFRPRGVAIHQLGAPIDSDVLTYSSQDPHSYIEIEKSTSGRYHFLYEFSLDGLQVMFMDGEKEKKEWEYLALKDSEWVVANHFNKSENDTSEHFYLYTTKNNPNGRIARVSTKNPMQSSWETYLNIEGAPNQRIGVDFGDDQFESFRMFEDYIVLSVESQARVKFKVVDRRTGESFMIEPPGSIYTSYPVKFQDYTGSKFRFYHSSFTQPSSIYEVDLATRESKKIWQRRIKEYREENYVAYRIYAPSKDGKLIPMSLLHKKDIVLDGNNPVIIDGYGAAGTYPNVRFNGSPMVSLLERGIVYVKTHLRGDGGFGSEWIKDGRILKKKNTFSDFVSCVEHLIDTGYTKPQKIVARGGSAGGLLMGVVANLRPDLFNGLHIGVPVMDAVSFMTNDSMFVVPYMYAEFGNPENEDVYRYIKSYSPYQNIVSQQYPNMLLYSAYNDLRAGYWEATKYVAKLRSLKTDNNPILLQTDFNASHDLIGGLQKRLQQTALEFAWYFKILGIEEDYTKLTGRVTNTEGQPLPFSHVNIAGKNKGTVANDSGYFELEIRRRDIELAFSHVGYESKTLSVKSENLSQQLHIELAGESLMLDEVVISTNYENPAQEIMKQALERRKIYKEKLNSYSARVYVRTRQYLESLPDKLHPLIGKNTFPEKGIFELSETESEIYYQQKPKRFREIMVSSVNKVRSKIRPFSWHRASNMGIDFYKQLIKLDGQREIISPFSSNAFFYYNFEYHGLQKQGNHSIHKIELKPRRDSDPVFDGYIYIADSTWDLSAIDVKIRPVSLRFLTAASINQKLLPQEDGFWLPVAQNKKLKAKVLGVELLSDDDMLYSEYDVNRIFTREFFQKSSFEIDPAANKKDSSYWEIKRPLLMTDHEREFYGNVDSVENSARVNKYTLDNLFGGFKNKPSGIGLPEIEVSGLFQALQFNTVEGWNVDFDLTYSKRVPYSSNRKLTFFSNWRYGFSNEQFNARVGTLWNINRSKSKLLEVQGGQYVFQFNEANPITPAVNSLYTLFLRNNYMKIYQKLYGRFLYQSEVKSGLYVFTSLQMEKRRSLVNNSNYSFSKGNELFTTNDPQNPGNPSASFNSHQAAFVELGAKYQFNQKYETIGERRIVKSSNPTVGFTIKKGLKNVLDSEISFTNVDLFLEGRANLGVFGRSSLFSNYGRFIENKNLSFVDYKHFNGNQTDIILPHAEGSENFTPTRSFRLLDYYSMSTTSEYVQLHYSHHFNGFIMNKLPLVRKTNFSSIAGFSFLANGEGTYREVYLGFRKTILQTVTFGLDIVKSTDHKGAGERGIRFVLRN